MVSFAVREKVLISHPIPDRPIPNSDLFGECLHAPFASRVVDFPRACHPRARRTPTAVDTSTLRESDIDPAIDRLQQILQQ